MATPYGFKVVTPDRSVYDGTATFIVVRTTEGEIGILAHHVNLVTPLVSHILAITEESGTVQHLHIGGGFLEVGSDQVVILAESAEYPDEIDVERARAARERAQVFLAKTDPDVDLLRAKAALARAENRLKLANR